MKKWTVLLLLPIFVGCSGSTKDVRLRLCEDLTVKLLGNGSSQISWLPHELVMKSHDDLQVRLKYSLEGKSGTATCFYEHDAIEDNIMTASNPITAYSTYPSKMLLNGAPVDRKLLSGSVNAVMLNQAKEVISPNQNKP